METMREFMKGGANIHVKSHYRTVNGKLVYVHDHDKMGSPVGTEAQLHERVQHAKNPAHLMAIDPEDRDTVLKHAGQLGLKPEVKYQGGKIKDHEGQSKAHGFHYIKFDNEEDAKKVHASITAESKGEGKPAEAPAQQQEPEQPKDKVGTHPNDAVKAAESKLQGFISYGKPGDIKAAIEGSTGITPEAGLTVVEQGIKYTQEAIDAAEAYEKETGQKAPNAQTYHEIMAKLNTWKAQLQEKVEGAEASTSEQKPAEEPKAEPTPQDQLSSHMAEAEKHFHSDPAKAVDALRKGAELAEKHGIGYTHSNGKAVDAAWMKETADKIEAAMPKAPAVDEKYTKAAKGAMDASAAANEHTKGLTADFQNGEHTPDKAESAMKGHVAAKEAHRNAKAAHKKAADEAPTPELKQHHESEAAKHDAKADVHDQAAYMHAKQHKKNQTQGIYDTEESKAAAESQTANDHSKEKLHSESPDNHHDAASLHESAAKAHTGMIQHALANGDDKAALKHGEMVTKHKQKAAYHKAAAEAWKATGEGDHEKAALAHGAANHHAEQAGLTDAAAKHMEVGKKHSEDAFKQKKAVDKKADYEAKFKHAIDLTDAANKSGSHDDHVAAAEAHYEAHKAAKEVHGEDSDHAKMHLKLNKQHGEQANKAHQNEQGKSPEPTNPWKGQDHEQIANAGHAADNNGNFSEAIKHFKHAAVVAHHNGDPETAAYYASKVKELTAKGVQKAVAPEPFTGNPQTLVVAIQSAAIQLHREKQQVRNMLKAVDTMPSFGKLQKACAQATQAGITGIDDIVAHALGGKQQAAPYLAFLAEVSR